MRRPWSELVCCAVERKYMAGAQFLRDEAVGILNRLRIVRLRNLCSPNGRDKESSLLESVQTFPGVKPPSYSAHSAVSYPEAKATVKADSHIACRAHAVPLPCCATKSLECVFPI